MPTTLHLVRHAAYGLLDRALGGRLPGHGLTEAGQAQATALADALAGRRIAAVLSGPLERARETAAPVAARHGLPVMVEPGLHELDFGAWTGLPLAALEGRADWAAWNAFRSTAAIPGGEGMLAAQARALAAVARLRAAHPEGEVVAVSHAEIVRGLLCHALGVPLDLFWRIEVSPASRSVLEWHDGGVRVLAMNLPPGCA